MFLTRFYFFAIATLSVSCNIFRDKSLDSIYADTTFSETYDDEIPMDFIYLEKPELGFKINTMNKKFVKSCSFSGKYHDKEAVSTGIKEKKNQYYLLFAYDEKTYDEIKHRSGTTSCYFGHGNAHCFHIPPRTTHRKKFLKFLNIGVYSYKDSKQHGLIQIYTPSNYPGASETTVELFCRKFKSLWDFGEEEEKFSFNF